MWDHWTVECLGQRGYLQPFAKATAQGQIWLHDIENARRDEIAKRREPEQRLSARQRQRQAIGESPISRQIIVQDRLFEPAKVVFGKPSPEFEGRADREALVKVGHEIDVRANEIAQPSDLFKRLQADGFKDWRLSVEGLVAQPASLSLDDIKRFPVRRQITEIACEEGWSYVAEWAGTPLIEVLRAAGVMPQACYVVYFSIQRSWWDSIDMTDALHPQTLLTYAMNDGDLPVGFGGPLRLRLPRQLGYKSVKFINRLAVTDSLKPFGKGLGSASAQGGYAWYAGI